MNPFPCLAVFWSPMAFLLYSKLCSVYYFILVLHQGLLISIKTLNIVLVLFDLLSLSTLGWLFFGLSSSRRYLWLISLIVYMIGSSSLMWTFFNSCVSLHIPPEWWPANFDVWGLCWFKHPFCFVLVLNKHFVALVVLKISSLQPVYPRSFITLLKHHTNVSVILLSATGFLS